MLRSLFVLFALVALLPTASRGDEFRIETKIYAGKFRDPVNHNTTLFQAGYVYDYLSNPPRVAVFDQRGGRFIILDPERKLKAEVQTLEVKHLIDRLQELASRNSIPIVRFAANPEFTVKFSENGTLTLSSALMTYKLKTIPAPSAAAAEQYHEFSDWYARFNTMAQPGSTPPFPRLKVNAELAQRGLVPTEVHLNTRSVDVRTEHVVAWRLLDADHKRIAETANQLTTFELVDFEDIEPPDVSSRLSAVSAEKE